MDQATYDQVWHDVHTDVYNRSKGAFKRALWYGNNSRLFGQNKGLRKAIRSAPRAVAMGALGAGLGAASVPPGISDGISMAADVVLNKGEDIYSAHVKGLIRGDPPMSTQEALRKRIKGEVKDLKSNAFQVIDRNLVKLRDAKNKVSPATQALMSSLSHMSYAQVSSNLAVPTNEEQMQKAHDALRAVAETEYYVDKLMGLVATTQEALEKSRKDLDTFKGATVQTRNELGDYIKEVL